MKDRGIRKGIKLHKTFVTGKFHSQRKLTTTGFYANNKQHYLISPIVTKRDGHATV
jgi:hypothetical protein